MTRHIEATPDQVLAVYGGLLGGAFVVGLWWATWRLSGSAKARRTARLAVGMATRGRDVAHPMTTEEIAALVRGRR